MIMVWLFIFFFFQAEDGIRDKLVTGVQTCALPISDPSDLHPAHGRAPVEAHADERVAAQRRPDLGPEPGRRRAEAGRDPGGGARLLPGAAVPELRQPRPA